MAKLYINEGGKEAVYELFDDSPEVTVGRGAANAVQIADAHASKVHFVLRRIRDRWKMVDLESKNGTRVNGTYKNAHWLAQNDTLTVGSVVLRFDAEGDPAGAPPRAAVPALASPARTVAPAAVARAAVAAVPVAVAPAARPAVPAAARPAAAAVARPAAPAAARPAAARPAAPVTAAPRRARDVEYEEDEDGERRFAPRKTGMSGGVIALLIVVAVGVLGLILAKLLPEDNPNSLARSKASKLASNMQYDEALQVLHSESAPGETGYKIVLEEIAKIEGLKATKLTRDRYGEAEKWHKQYIYLIATGGKGAGAWNPKDAPPPREAAQRLREFIRLFGDTSLARGIVNGTGENDKAYQRILRDNQDPNRTDKTAFAEIETEIRHLEDRGRFGAAHDRLSFALQAERLNLPAAAYTSFESRVKEKQDRLRVQAFEALDKALGEARAFVAGGDKARAKAFVESALRTIAWPDGEVKRRADDAMRAW